MSEKPERLDIRLSEEEKRTLAELAKQRGISMTDLVKTWIMRGDVVYVLAEQLHDFVKDFDKWHVAQNRNTSINYLCEMLQGRMDRIEDASRRKMLYAWIAFFGRGFSLLKEDVSVLKRQLGRAVKEMKHTSSPKKTVLITSIQNFAHYIISYHHIFVQGFLDILQNMDERTKKDIGERYNDEFRTRYNEIASKYEDFLKRAQRELGDEFEQAMPRAKEFRAKE